jgi:hypothetical protein
MIHLPRYNKSFVDKSQMFEWLKTNKTEIISMKKATVKHSDSISGLYKIESGEIVKSLSPKERIKFGDYVYPVINTTNYLDSHDDMHVNGIWDKSVNEQQGKVYFVADHKLEVDKIISRQNEVEMMVQQMTWKELGYDYLGENQALIFKSLLTERSMKAAFEAIQNNDPVEYSIRMMYVTLSMAVNSTNSGYKEEYAAWNKFFPMVANKQKAEDQGYFFAVTDAKIYKEGSMVLAGSNDATRTLYDLDKKEPGKHSIQSRPTTHKIDINKLINEFKKQ